MSGPRPMTEVPRGKKEKKGKKEEESVETLFLSQAFQYRKFTKELSEIFDELSIDNDVEVSCGLEADPSEDAMKLKMRLRFKPSYAVEPEDMSRLLSFLSKWDMTVGIGAEVNLEDDEDDVDHCTPRVLIELEKEVFALV